MVDSRKLEFTYVDPEQGLEYNFTVMQHGLEFPYQDIDGRPLTGEALLFHPEQTCEQVPIIVDIHYEMAAEAAA